MLGILTLSVWADYVSKVGVPLGEMILRILTLSVWADYVSKVDVALGRDDSKDPHSQCVARLCK